MTEHGTFFWNQLVTADQKKSGDFYCELLGWSRREVDAGPFGRYTLFQRDGKDVGGMMNRPPTIPVHGHRGGRLSSRSPTSMLVPHVLRNSAAQS